MSDSANFCADCGAALPQLALVCPGCQALVYKLRLQELVAQAKSEEAGGNFDGARLTWRQALLLLPADSAQAKTIETHVASLDLKEADHVEQREHEEKKASFLKRFTGPLAVVGLALWKFKWILAAAWTKGKFLLMGLGKMKTVFTMLASMGVYWNWFGWKYAVGFILGIYIHEMGHVWTMRRYGMQPSAPMFIPGLGAFVAAYKAAANDHQSARVGLAGPIWGLGSAVACTAAAITTGEPIWRALAQSLAFINLLNLLPFWIFDGGFGIKPLTKQQRLLVIAAAFAMLVFAGVGFNIFLLMGLGYRTFVAKDNAETPDWRVAIEFIGLIITLGVLSSIPAERPDRL